MNLVTNKQFMKVMTLDFDNKLRHIMLALLILGLCGTRCDEKRNEHPNSRALISDLSDKDLMIMWENLGTVANDIVSEKWLTRLEFDGNNILLNTSKGDIIHSTLVGGKITPTTAFRKNKDGSLVQTVPSQSLSDADATSILKWVDKCKTNGICGFDVRALPEYYRIAIRSRTVGGVYFIILTKETSLSYREQLNKYAKEGSDPRGDIVAVVTNDVYVATERR